MSMKLYVGNLAFQTSSEDLQQLFAQAGTVESAAVVEDRARKGVGLHPDPDLRKLRDHRFGKVGAFGRVDVHVQVETAGHPCVGE